MSEQLVQGGGVVREHGAAAAGTERAVMHRDAREALAQPGCERLRMLAVGLRRDHRELIAPVADDDVMRSHRIHQRFRHFLENSVAVLVAVPVVHELEVVQVQEHQGERMLMATVALELNGQPLGQHPVVGHPRERVTLGQHAIALLARLQALAEESDRPCCEEERRDQDQALLEGTASRLRFVGNRRERGERCERELESNRRAALEYVGGVEGNEDVVDREDRARQPDGERDLERGDRGHQMQPSLRHVAREGEADESGDDRQEGEQVDRRRIGGLVKGVARGGP